MRTTVKATGTAAKSAASPAAATATWIASLVATPAVASSPAFGPPRMPQPRMNSMYGPGVTIATRVVRTKARRRGGSTAWADPDTRAAPGEPVFGLRHGAMMDHMATDYDSFAEAYAAENETSLMNAYYTLPAVVDLAGDVAGRRILDAGCGSGPLFAALRERGAIVTGIDSSAGMGELARRRLGADSDLQSADLAGPLPFPDGTFDDVIASLVLHYLEDWRPTLTELRRVLTPGGRLIVSVDHPFAIHGIQRLAGRRTNYFETYNWTEEWTMGG